MSWVDTAPWITWQCINVGNGKIALKADTGKYLGRCPGCAYTTTSSPSNQALFVKDTTSQSPSMQFTVIRKPTVLTLTAADTTQGFVPMLAGACVALVAV
ncbi:Aste57867_4478 [Aphanomyces stellatus]|uniref:Aste57867_4478 protein n=1 Tax=Aphanomyces stellatus TaxID=120398 RepID=A0A485KCV3_9STRA|nr:hypothetical protein As57867_004466 [Aphanomyces stellatus]VFT81589.1 Aste57867_4478 [Aphanomyces stellatus]